MVGLMSQVGTHAMRYDVICDYALIASYLAVIGGIHSNTIDF